MIGGVQAALPQDLRAHDALRGGPVAQQVVDAPAAVQLARLPAVGPPRVGTLGLADLRPHQIDPAIVEQTEQATSTILEAAERLEEGISHIRDTHAEDQLIINTADQMVDAITAIYEASNFQDITGQRIRKVVDVLPAD